MIASFNLLACLSLAAAPTEIGTAFIIPMSHTDIGFTAPPREVARLAARHAGQALELARKDPDYVWNFEVFWELEQSLDPERQPGLPPVAAAGVTATQPSSRPATGELLELVRQGRFGIGAAYVNPHTSLMSAWALDQLFRVPCDWARGRGLTLDWAVINDVPGHPPDLPHFAAKNGIRYLLLGVNQSLSKPLPAEVCNTPFWWEAPDGSRVLTWISAKAYTEAFTDYGLDPGTARFFNGKEFPQTQPVEVMAHGMQKLREEYSRRQYPYDAVPLLHAFDNWDASGAGRLPEAVRLWNASGGKPRLVLATAAQFFRHIEERFGPTLPVRRGGFGGQWELVRTGAPSAMARARAREEELLKAGNPSPEDIRRLLVYWEHSYSLSTPWPGYLTPEVAVEQNRQQWEMVADWPLPKAFPPAPGPAVKLPPADTNSTFQPNGLYLAGFTFITWSEFRPLPKEVVLASVAERLEDGGLRCRHQIDRRKLPDPAHVMWAWKLTETESTAPVVIRTATGTTRYPDDGLGGYAQFHWVAPRGFEIGSSRFLPRGPFAFARPPKHPGWLLAFAVGQGRSVTYKGGRKDQMTFEEVYQGEEPIYDFSIDIHPATTESPRP